MDLPLRAKNEMLAAGGYPAAYEQTPIADDDLGVGVRTALDLMLERHEPFPVFIMDAQFDIVRTNRSLTGFSKSSARTPTRSATPRTGTTCSCIPISGATRYATGPTSLRCWWACSIESLQSPDNRALSSLLDEVLEFPDVAACGRAPDLDTPATSVLTFHFESPGFTGAFLSTLTTFVAPNNITVEELAIESYFPLDDATTQACHHTLDLPR